MISDVEHPFMCLLAICISSFYPYFCSAIYNVSFFPLYAFKISPLFLVLINLIMMCLAVAFSCFFCLEFLVILECVVL